MTTARSVSPRWRLVAAVAVAVAVVSGIGIYLTRTSTKASASPAALKVLASVATGRDVSFGRAQAEVATCMHAKGQPYVIETIPAPVTPTDGYGLSTQPAEGTDPTAPDPADPQGRDAMTDAQRAAFDAALTGNSTATTEDPASCFGQAWNDIMVPAQKALVELQPDLATAWKAYTADPKMVTANAAWAKCMATKGFPGQTSPEATRAAYADNPEPTDPTVAQTQERATATADRDCQTVTGYAAVQTATQSSYLTAVANNHIDAVNTIGGLR